MSDVLENELGTNEELAGSCTVCGAARGEPFYIVNGRVICERCTTRHFARSNAKDVMRPWRALAYGLLAGALCVGVVSAIGAIIPEEAEYVFWSLIGSGWAVGTAIMIGTRNISGPGYQALSAMITYVAFLAAWCIVMPENTPDWSPTGLLRGAIEIPISVFVASPMTGVIGILAVLGAWVVPEKGSPKIVGPIFSTAPNGTPGSL